MPTAFLTGATGFVGSHAARALCAAGWQVRALARPKPQAQGGRLRADVLGATVEEIAGDLSDEGPLRRAATGADAIVHVAGLVKARSLEEYRDVNVRGTERLLAACREAAPDAVFLYLSSQAAAGPSSSGAPVSENDPPRPVSWYGLSKREGERAVEREWRGPWTVLRPGVVYGAGDRGLLVYFRMAAAGWVPVPAPRRRIQLIEAGRVGDAIHRALTTPDAWGRIGFLCDPAPIRVQELARMIATLPPRRPHLVPVPDALVRLLGLGETLRERLTGRSRPFNADKAREILAGDWICDGEPTRARLRLPPPIGLAEGLRTAWTWYERAGWL
jgi:nucleoside-diphosphate-sugar epimerase